MGNPPAYVFVVRHGNRLDVADKDWVLGSATPYDPPLTYGGWLQARSLGARIARILRQAEAEGSGTEGSGDGGKKKRRRFNIVLHSSPFLRCIQTSIGISAGLCEPPTSQSVYMRASRSNSVASTKPLASPTLKEADAAAAAGAAHLFGKVVLRLDAFLGEWLSPEYFEMITPPPASSTMVTMAKANLLRRENYASYGDPSLQTPSVVARQAPPAKKQNGEPLDMSRIASALADAEAVKPTGYMAPAPHYAISNNAPIPDGYVAHARDACVSVDSQWDSASLPLDWGDGGTYGEEWTAMHRRFRKGVQSLVDWYSGCEKPEDAVAKTFGPTEAANGNGVNGHAKDVVPTENGNENEEDEGEEEESVVILVSHGAGCNALIGAITHQPALMDVGTASLTMAVRKPGGCDDYDDCDDPTELDDNGACVLIHQSYDMKLTASTDHLRSSASPPASRPPPGATLAMRGRVNTMSSQAPVIGAFAYCDPHRSSSASASFGPVRRESSSRVVPAGPAPADSPAASAMNSFFARPPHSRKTSLGLWSPIRQDTGEEDEEDDYFPDFDNRRFAPKEKKMEKQPSISETEVMVSEPFGTPRTPLSPLSPPVVSRRPSRQQSEASDDVTAMHLGFGSVNSGGLWTNPRTEPHRRWTIDEAA